MESRIFLLFRGSFVWKLPPTGKVKSGIPVMSFGKSCASVDCYTRHGGCYTDPEDIFHHLYVYTYIMYTYSIWILYDIYI